MEICMLWEKTLLTGWSQVQGGILASTHCFSGELRNMKCYVVPYTLCQLSHHTLCYHVQLVALSACWSTLSSSGFRILVVTSSSRLLCELLDIFGSNKLPGFFCCLLDGSQLVLHIDDVRCDSSHLSLNVITDIGFIYGWWGIGTSNLSDFEMRKLHVWFQ